MRITSLNNNLSEKQLQINELLETITQQREQLDNLKGLQSHGSIFRTGLKEAKEKLEQKNQELIQRLEQLREKQEKSTKQFENLKIQYENLRRVEVPALPQYIYEPFQKIFIREELKTSLPRNSMVYLIFKVLYPFNLQ